MRKENYMRALLKENFKQHDRENGKKFAGKWVKIETKFLSKDQYNTTEADGNMRIFDGDIQRIEDDVRVGKGRCNYCGAIVEKGHEEEHFAEMEKKKTECDMNNTDCSTCFWKSKKYLGETEISKTSETITEREVATTLEVITKEQRWKPYCSHSEKYHGCMHDEHREMGIDWFTKQNCFFLKYPNGVDDFTIQTMLENSWNARWTDSKTCFKNVTYSKMLGSYSLELKLKGDEKTIDYLELKNARNRFVFTYDKVNDCYITRDGIANSPRIHKNLLSEDEKSPKVNKNVNKAVRMACQELYKYVKEGE